MVVLFVLEWSFSPQKQRWYYITFAHFLNIIWTNCLILCRSTRREKEAQFSQYGGILWLFKGNYYMHKTEREKQRPYIYREISKEPLCVWIFQIYHYILFRSTVYFSLDILLILFITLQSQKLKKFYLKNWLSFNSVLFTFIHCVNLACVTFSLLFFCSVCVFHWITLTRYFF